MSKLSGHQLPGNLVFAWHCRGVLQSVFRVNAYGVYPKPKIDRSLAAIVLKRLVSLFGMEQMALIDNLLHHRPGKLGGVHVRSPVFH